MEITTSPPRRATTPWGRLLLLVVVVAPVSVLVLLPIGLGLQRYVVTGGSMAGDRADSIARGSLVLERLVPVDELRPGDVITFRAPTGSGARSTITHRVVSVGPDGIRTRGDADPNRDPWLLEPGGSVVPRVAWTLPGVGYAYLALDDWRFWAGLAVLVGAGVAVSSRMSTRPRRTARPPRWSTGNGAPVVARDAGGMTAEVAAGVTAGVPVGVAAGVGPSPLNGFVGGD